MKPTHVPLLAAVAAATLLLGACSSDDDGPSAAPSPTETATSPAPPTIEPIEPEVAVAARSVSSGAVIDRSQSRPADQAAVDAMAESVRTWLDAHLDDLQRGGSGKLADIASAGLLDGADPALIEGVTTGLASPEDPVRGTGYDFEVGHDGAPRWLRARVRVARHSGTTSEATFVFVPNEELPAVLVALEPRGGAA